MDGNNLLRHINELESNLGYSLEPSYATLTSVLPSESYSMHVDQENANYIEININNNERGINYHLDHKYSISEGFKNNILPSIVGGKENLRIISSYENMSKGSKCSIKLSELIIK